MTTTISSFHFHARAAEQADRASCHCALHPPALDRYIEMPCETLPSALPKVATSYVQWDREQVRGGLCAGNAKRRVQLGSAESFVQRLNGLVGLCGGGLAAFASKNMKIITGTSCFGGELKKLWVCSAVSSLEVYSSESTGWAIGLVRRPSGATCSRGSITAHLRALLAHAMLFLIYAALALPVRSRNSWSGGRNSLFFAF